MYIEENGMMFRYAEFDSGKGGAPVAILQLTDLYLNCLNARDVIEQRPCIVSTREFRKWCKDGGNGVVTNAVNAMKMSEDYDQVIITGDTLDYLTWGTLDLVEEIIWKTAPKALVALGGHDITRVMQGIVPDETTLESRREILQNVWRHDIDYVSKVLDDKVCVIVLNNGEGRYFASQGQKLAEDIRKARENGWLVLLFQHEPLCTYNEKEKYVEYIRTNDPNGSHNFYEEFMGNSSADEETKRVYRIITENADVIKGVFCGHRHCDIYTEIIASYTDKDGEKKDTVIPQYVLTGNVYDQGHAFKIVVR